MTQAKQDKQLVLGIDPGTRVTGYGLVERSGCSLSTLDFGCIRPPAKEALSKRYEAIFHGVTQLIENHSPSVLVVETQFVQKNAQSALKLGMARGVTILAATLKDIPVYEYAPTKAKLAVVGNGRASKEQVQAMVQRLLNLKALPQPEDAADALALAICHLHSNDRQLMGTRV